MVTIRLALSSELSVTAIMGIPFIRSADMVLHLNEGFCFSNVFQKSFTVEFDTPRCHESVVPQGGQTPVFVAPPNGSIPPAVMMDPNNPKAQQE